MNKTIPVFRPTFTTADKRQLNAVIDSGRLTEGAKTQEFEDALKGYLDVEYVVTVPSGGVALYLSLLSVGVKSGDEVIVPDYQHISLANAVRMIGAKPRFIDIDPKDGCIKWQDIPKVETSKTKCLAVVNMNGRYCNFDSIFDKVGGKYAVIEDSCQAFPSTQDDTHLFSAIGSLSFHPTKWWLPCFPPRTHISVRPPKGRKGLRTIKFIEEIKVGDEVLSYNEKTGEKEFDVVTKTFEHETDSLTKISFSNGNQISATSNHPIFIVNRGWVPVCQIQVGDKAVQYRYNYIGGRILGLKCVGKTAKDIFGEERSQQISEKRSRTLVQRHREGFWDSAYDDEMRNRISESNRRRRGISKRGTKHTEIFKALQSKRLQDLWVQIKSDKERYQDYCNKVRSRITPETREKMRKRSQLLAKDKEYLKRMGEAVRQAYKNPVLITRKREIQARIMCTSEYWEKYWKGMNARPNKPEKKLEKIIESVCPDEFKYNGNFALGVHIGRMTPDFVNVNGKKKVIELLGEHWHEPEEAELRKRTLSEQGFDSLMIWERELKDVNEVEKKVLTFLYNPNVEIVEVTDIKEESYKGNVYNLETTKNHNYFAYGILVHNCGTGGAIFTNDRDIYVKIKELKDYGRFVERTSMNEIADVYENWGLNFRFNELMSAVGLAQFEFLNERIDRVKEIRLAYLERLNPPLIPSKEGHVPWVFDIKVDNPPRMKGELARRGIETRLPYVPLHHQPLYRKNMSYIGSDIWSGSCLWLPSSPSLTDDEVDSVIKNVNEVYDKIEGGTK